MIVCLVNSGRPHPEVKFHDLIAAVVGDAALAGLGDDTADVTAVVGVLVVSQDPTDLRLVTMIGTTTATGGESRLRSLNEYFSER